MSDKQKTWNSIDSTEKMDNKHLTKKEMEYAVCFIEEYSDFETKEWSRVLLRRIAVTIRKEILDG